MQSRRKRFECYDLEKAVLSKIFIQNATEVFVLADCSKVGLRANFKMVPIEKIDKLISDAGMPDGWELPCEWITS